MNHLIEAYKEQSGAGRVVANYSDSALLGDQIRNNANCDIFICDDPAILDQLTEEKLADAESRAAFLPASSFSLRQRAKRRRNPNPFTNFFSRKRRLKL